MNAFIAAVRAIVWKDLASEWRSREQMASMFFFALLTLFIFNFSLNLDPAQVRELMPGLIWIAFSFTAVIGPRRSFIAERENDCLDALLMSPAPKGALYLGKLTANLLFTLAVEVVLFPLFVLVFAALLPPHPAIMVTSIAVHNNVLTIFFFIENPPP